MKWTRSGGKLQLSIFVEREGWKTCDILQTALPFATSNKVSLFFSVVQIVFSNLYIISICCLNGCIIMQCPALVHVGYWCIVYPCCCKLSFTDVSIKTYLGYLGLFSQMYLSLITIECIWLCSADKILVHIITYWHTWSLLKIFFSIYHTSE